jgi:hypothetical protein
LSWISVDPNFLFSAIGVKRAAYGMIISFYPPPSRSRSEEGLDGMDGDDGRSLYYARAHIIVEYDLPSARFLRETTQKR